MERTGRKLTAPAGRGGVRATPVIPGVPSDDDEEPTVRTPRSVVLATALLLTGVAGCGGDDEQPSTAPPPVPASPASAPASAAGPAPTGATTPTRSRTATATATSKPATPRPATPATEAFPLTVSRQGGFAGVDDRVSIAADGSAVVTRRGGSPVRTSLPDSTMAELRRLLTSPDFARRSAPADRVVCNDGYEYEFTSRTTTVTVSDCGNPHGATMDRLLALVARLLRS